MLQSCTKFRVFSILLVICAINLLVFRNYVQTTLQATDWGWAGNSTLVTTTQMDITEKLRGGPDGTSKVDTINGATANSLVELRQTARLNGSNITFSTLAVGAAVGTVDSLSLLEKKLDPVGGPGPLMKAFGKVVMPQANVTAPWLGYNTTSLCPLVPPKLVGPLATYKEAPSFSEIVTLNAGLELGGHFHPPDCRARHRVAVIVPYRDREEHLRILVHNLHPILIRQQLDYAIFVVELAQPTIFNRAMLMNIGAVEALGLWDFQCFVFHDVDLVPENDRNIYSCPENPRHMSAAVDKFNYQLPYQGLFGGVAAMTREHFFKANGYSNKYFGWGGEDDDMASRVYGSGLKVTRYSMDIARYKMIKHNRNSKNEPNPKRFEMLNKWKLRHEIDGLNSLQYSVNKVEFREAYTWILVSIDMEKVMKS